MNELPTARMPHIKREYISMLECDDGTKKPILVGEFAENCYHITSFTYRRTEYGDTQLSVHTSFFYDNGGVGVEWEPCYGPIQVWRRCDKDWEGTEGTVSVKARRHWFYDYVQGNAMNWSQLAVDDEGLKDMLLRGDYEDIFYVLRRWSTRGDE